jgi:hypothetical protein
MTVITSVLLPSMMTNCVPRKVSEGTVGEPDKLRVEVMVRVAGVAAIEGEARGWITMG